MRTLDLKCPYCEFEEQIEWDGAYKPRYRACSGCGKRYIYEPLKDSVECVKLEDARYSKTPEYWATEMAGSCEQ
ncbi:MAG: hypothetical protein ACOWWM_04265 [Desulfobacterales bacterium]